MQLLLFSDITVYLPLYSGVDLNSLLYSPWIKASKFAFAQVPNASTPVLVWR